MYQEGIKLTIANCHAAILTNMERHKDNVHELFQTKER